MSTRMRLISTMILLALFLLAACKPEATQEPTLAEPQAATEVPAVTDAPAATEAPAPTDAPKEPLVSTYIMWQGFFDLDPAYAYASESVVLNQCYENLIFYNPPGSAELLKPWLSTAWEANEDGTEWTFQLREGVEFHDGTPFTSEAVKATIEHYKKQEGAGCTWIWDSVEEVELVGDYSVKLHLSYSAPIDLIASASFCGEVMSPSAMDKPKEWFFEGNCAGTGPYTIESFEQGQRLIMTRFDDYWGGWKENQFDKIVYEIVSDPVVALQMMQAGEADFWYFPPVDKIAGLDAMEELTSIVRPSFQNMMFMLNTVKPPLDNKLVRQALAYSFPYDQLIEKSDGIFDQSRGAAPPGMWGHSDDLFQYYFDLDKARELLAEAGYPDGGFELQVTYMTDFTAEAWAVELWKFPLAELGIELKAQGMTFDALWELAKSDPSMAQDIGTFSWWPTWITPYDVMAALYHCEDEPFFNITYWCNPEYDELIDDANVLTGIDRETATQKFIAAQEILLEEVPTMFLVDLPQSVIAASDIDGVVVNPAYNYVVFYHDLTTTR